VPTLHLEPVLHRLRLAAGDAPQELYLRMVGDRSLRGDVVFICRDMRYTPEPRRNCVSVEMMLRVAKHVFERGALPDWVEWEEV
jgi:hypothetical protein